MFYYALDTCTNYSVTLDTSFIVKVVGSVPGSKKIPAARHVEINLDRSSSDRPEWCTVRYDGIFCPDNAYVVHLRWLVSTGSVINQLVGKC